MGASESSPYQNHGFRVLSIAEGSPISKASSTQGDISSTCNICEMVDFICYEPSDLQNSFIEVLQSYKDKEITVQVYNMITKQKRDVKLTPSDRWGGNGLLGASIRYEDYSEAHLKVAYVSKVYEGSPAEEAGLVEGTDFIIGHTEYEIEKLSDIGKICTEGINQEQQFIVYSSLLNEDESQNNPGSSLIPNRSQIRRIKITPKKWDGVGLLGCELFMGLNFQIPFSIPAHSSLPPTSSHKEEDYEGEHEDVEGYDETYEGKVENEVVYEDKNEAETTIEQQQEEIVEVEKVAANKVQETLEQVVKEVVSDTMDQIDLTGKEDEQEEKKEEEKVDEEIEGKRKDEVEIEVEVVEENDGKEVIEVGKIEVKGLPPVKASHRKLLPPSMFSHYENNSMINKCKLDKNEEEKNEKQSIQIPTETVLTTNTSIENELPQRQIVKSDFSSPTNRIKSTLVSKTQPKSSEPEPARHTSHADSSSSENQKAIVTKDASEHYSKELRSLASRKSEVKKNQNSGYQL